MTIEQDRSNVERKRLFFSPVLVGVLNPPFIPDVKCCFSYSKFSWAARIFITTHSRRHNQPLWWDLHTRNRWQSQMRFITLSSLTFRARFSPASSGYVLLPQQASSMRAIIILLVNEGFNSPVPSFRRWRDAVKDPDPRVRITCGAKNVCGCFSTPKPELCHHPHHVLVKACVCVLW